MVRSMPENSTAAASLWCGRSFRPRRDSDKAQRFCRPACRRAFDAAGRRWVAEVLASGTLTIPDLRNASSTTRTLGGMRKILPGTPPTYRSPRAPF